MMSINEAMDTSGLRVAIGVMS